MMSMMEQHKHLRKDVTVVVPRDLWRRLKYEAWRRQKTCKQMLTDALEQALGRWKKESDNERASD